MDNIEERLNNIKQENLYRKIKYLSQAQDKYTIMDNKKILLMSSNNYLGLCNEKRVKESAVKSINKYGLGCGGSRLTTGSYDIHRKLENKISKFKGYEDTILFNNGYVANLGVISAICDENYYIFSDELNHASIIDGCKLSKGKTIVYKHNDMDDLTQKIEIIKPKHGVIITDSVFSMHGDLCNLKKIIEIANKNNLISIVDDAHATGVIGNTGRGSSEFFDVKPDITIGTLSKAIGSYGGFVCSSEKVIDYIKNRARSFIFSTALSPAVVGGAIKGIDIIENENHLIKKLNDNIKYFCDKLNKQGFDISSKTPIIPIFIGDEKKAVLFSEKLLEEGIYIPAIRYPTVKKGCAILRVTLMSSHDYKDIDFVVQKFKKVSDNIKNL